jgi:hypothetical protein
MSSSSEYALAFPARERPEDHPRWDGERIRAYDEPRPQRRADASIGRVGIHLDWPRIMPYKIGLCFASVCALDASPEEIEDSLNRSHPTGIASRWTISHDATFASGEPNPCVCNDDPSRLHWLLSC